MKLIIKLWIVVLKKRYKDKINVIIRLLEKMGFKMYVNYRRYVFWIK